MTAPPTYTYDCPGDLPGNRAHRIVGSKGAAKELQAATVPVFVKAVRVKNLSASVRSVFLGNVGAAPADGATPDLLFPDVNPGKSYELRPDKPVPFVAGLYVCSSTAAAQKTITGVPDAVIEVEVIVAHLGVLGLS